MVKANVYFWFCDCEALFDLENLQVHVGAIADLIFFESDSISYDMDTH